MTVMLKASRYSHAGSAADFISNWIYLFIFGTVTARFYTFTATEN